MTHYKVYDYTRSVGITLSTMIFNVRTFHCWDQVKMDVVEWWFGSDEVHYVPQLHRSLVLLCPLHNQLTLRDPLTWFVLIHFLPGDLTTGYIQY